MRTLGVLCTSTDRAPNLYPSASSADKVFIKTAKREMSENVVGNLETEASASQEGMCKAKK
jgi:hypothetical protein